MAQIRGCAGPVRRKDRGPKRPVDCFEETFGPIAGLRGNPGADGCSPRGDAPSWQDSTSPGGERRPVTTGLEPLVWRVAAGGRWTHSWKQQCRISPIRCAFLVEKTILVPLVGMVLDNLNSPPQESLIRRLSPHGGGPADLHLRLVALPATRPDTMPTKLVWDWARKEVQRPVPLPGLRQRIQVQGDSREGSPSPGRRANATPPKDEVRHGCRTLLQARADEPMFTPAVPLSLQNVVPRLALSLGCLRIMIIYPMMGWRHLPPERILETVWKQSEDGTTGE